MTLNSLFHAHFGRIGVLLFCSFVLGDLVLHAQVTPSYWFYDTIVIEGNQRTKEAYIKREVPTSANVPIHDWRAFQNECRNLLLNTGLFNNVWVFRDSSRHQLNIEVKEAFYTLPIPLLELADRNFNEWWVTHDASLKRLNYGLSFYHNNLSGRADQLKATLQFGFNQKFQASYEFPYLGPHLQWQPYFDLLFAHQAGVAVKTLEDRQVWLREEGERLLQRFRTSLGVRFRPGFRSFWSAELNYFHRTIDPLVVSENSSFFKEGETDQEFTALSLGYLGEYRDRPIYPMEGWRLQTKLVFQGLLPQDDLNTVHLSMDAQFLQAVTQKSSLSLQLFGRYFLAGEDQLPFYNSRGMGYGSVFPRSYEYHVIDGPNYLLGKTDFKWRWLSYDWNWGPLMFIEPLRCMPLESFLNVFLDWGFVHQPIEIERNDMPNEWVLGYGIGIDVLAYENFLVQIQYSRGIHNNQGIFIHLSSSY